ncbi:hypothetical protein LF910_08860 [Bifidobacterium pseudolongum]|nr:hypothetical protein [Bifidobacterium pseudolongum]MCH4857316.1 hypothetical protein [Bifidobacterium pseudolongum]
MQTSSSTEVDETVGMDGGAEAVVGREVEAAEDAAGKKLTHKERREVKKAAKMIGAQPIDKKHAFKLWLYVAPLLVLVFLSATCRCSAGSTRSTITNRQSRCPKASSWGCSGSR